MKSESTLAAPGFQILQKRYACQQPVQCGDNLTLCLFLIALIYPLFIVCKTVSPNTSMIVSATAIADPFIAAACCGPCLAVEYVPEIATYWKNPDALNRNFEF